MNTEQADLLRYLASVRDALVWKLDGLSEYDIRRPMTPTGTNLLGLVKHVASIEAGYLGDSFGRPFPDTFPWLDEDAEPNADLWATADQSREWVLDLYRRVAEHSTATVEALGLEAEGSVPWWTPAPAGNPVTVHRILLHVIAETNRHAGHADIIRELIDGAVGLRAQSSNMPDLDEAWWTAYRAKLEQIARDAG